MKKSNLVLVRHGQSEWNKKNLFTGWKDPKLTELGIEEAIKAGKILKTKEMKFDIMFTSDLFRAQETGRLILENMNQLDIPVIKNQSLNERNYGDLAGLNKDDAREKWRLSNRETAFGGVHNFLKCEVLMNLIGGRCDRK